MEQRRICAAGGQRDKAAVGVPENQYGVGPVARQRLVAAGQYLGYRLDGGFARSVQELVGPADRELIKEDLN